MCYIHACAGTYSVCVCVFLFFYSDKTSLSAPEAEKSGNAEMRQWTGCKGGAEGVGLQLRSETLALGLATERVWGFFQDTISIPPILTVGSLFLWFGKLMSSLERQNYYFFSFYHLADLRLCHVLLQWPDLQQAWWTAPLHAAGFVRCCGLSISYIIFPLTRWHVHLFRTRHKEH